MLVVVGAGVSRAATDDNPLAGWPGLLESGVEWCREVGATDDWVALRKRQIEQGELVSAAEEISRTLREAGEYDDWLEDSVGSLRIARPAVLDALKRLDAPFATTNYDNLLEEATRLDAVTWREERRFERVARGQEPGVLHLHGHYRAPDSVVLGTADYANIVGNKFAQAMQQALTSMTTLLLVGYGGGLADPNFVGLRRWMRTVFEHSGAWHYRLCLDDELEPLRGEHTQERIKLITYGAGHPRLAPFLNGLADDLWGPGMGPPGSSSSAPVRDPAPTTGTTTATTTGTTTAMTADTTPAPAGPHSRWRAAVVAVGKGLKRPVGGRDRPVPVWVAVALVVALVGGLLVATTVRSGPRSAAAFSCPVPLELVVLTTPTKEASIRRLAAEFAGGQAPPCRRSSVAVFSVPSSSAVAGALAAGWPVDDLFLGRSRRCGCPTPPPTSSGSTGGSTRTWSRSARSPPHRWCWRFPSRPWPRWAGRAQSPGGPWSTGDGVPVPGPACASAALTRRRRRPASWPRSSSTRGPANR